jgi:nucleoside-diphosphate-sugar epimerase
MENILIIGAAGQIGSELTLALRKIYGDSHVYATDIKDAPPDIKDNGPFQLLDVMDDRQLIHFVIRHKITQIYHLAAVLSGNAEKLPLQAWHINMNSLMNVLEVAKLVEDVNRVFWPSSIAVFGPSTPRLNTPQLTTMEPSTVYGISKLAGERWCEYYYKKFGVDVRSIRYPGLISYKTEAGGGTTDWAVEIFYEAIRQGEYTCFLSGDTKQPMLFMEDAINATIRLMEVDSKRLNLHTGYNIMGESLCPEDVAAEIRKHIPGFRIKYAPDFRQEIAMTWPESVDDSMARMHDDWMPVYNLRMIAEIMLHEIGKKINN